MFGSLLASYVLGFIGFFAMHTDKLSRETLVAALPYLFISFTFAYLTAGFYLSYNAGILTMPHMPLENLRWDFLLALSQAIAFGFSMLIPKATLIFLGFALLFALLRQRAEHKRLAVKLHSKWGKPIQADDRDDQEAVERRARRDFGRALNKILKDNEQKYSQLTGWKAPQVRSYLGAIGLVFGGILVCWGTAITRKEWSAWPPIGILAITFLVAVVTFWRVHGILRERAMFLYKRDAEEKADTQYKQLLEELRSYGKSNS
jgi:hypothetical protein